MKTSLTVLCVLLLSCDMTRSNRDDDFANHTKELFSGSSDITVTLIGKETGPETIKLSDRELITQLSKSISFLPTNVAKIKKPITPLTGGMVRIEANSRVVLVVAPSSLYYFREQSLFASYTETSPGLWRKVWTIVDGKDPWDP